MTARRLRYQNTHPHHHQHRHYACCEKFPAQSSPFAQQSHQAGPKTHDAKSGEHDLQAGPAHDAAEHELVGHQLDETGVDEDAGGDAVEDAVDHERGLRAGRVRLPDAEPDGDGERCAEGVADAEDVRRAAVMLRPGGGGEAGAEPEALEGLVEDEDDVEGGEFVAGDGEREADEDGVEDHAEFEDEDGCQLGGVVFHVAGSGVVGLLRSGRVRGCYVACSCRHTRAAGRWPVLVLVFDVIVCVGEVIFPWGMAG